MSSARGQCHLARVSLGTPVPNGKEVPHVSISLGFLYGKQCTDSPLGWVPSFPDHPFRVYMNLSVKKKKKVLSDIATGVFLEQTDTSC